MIPRIYQNTPLGVDQSLQLSPKACHHLIQVLRRQIKDEVIVFNGEGGEYVAHITKVQKKTVTVYLKEQRFPPVESPAELWLAQGISRGDKMDYVIQKAVELGVKKIIPLLTERCQVKLNDERGQKRLQHWQAIIVSACEQCGRCIVPEVSAPITYADWQPPSTGFILAPGAPTKLKALAGQPPPPSPTILLIGPEAGFSMAEVRRAEEQGFISLNLGPRILRTETAAVAALTALQCFMGDMA